MNWTFLELGVILHFELSENGWDTRQTCIKGWKNIQLIRRIYAFAHMDASHLPALYVCVWATNEAHLHAAVALLLLYASVKSLGSPGLLRQHPPPTHTLLCPSLTWITHDQTVCVELMSQLLREPQRHWWLHNTIPLLATRCPRCRVMNYGSPFSALFCCAVKAITCGLVQHGWSSNTWTAKLRLWCNVDPTAVCPWACRWGYMLEHAYEGRFNWYFYACVNKHPAEYLIVVKVVRHCSYLS